MEELVSVVCKERYSIDFKIDLFIVINFSLELVFFLGIFLRKVSEDMDCFIFIKGFFFIYVFDNYFFIFV